MSMESTTVIEYILNEKEWIFSGIGVFLIPIIWAILFKNKQSKVNELVPPNIIVTNTNTFDVNKTPDQPELLSGCIRDEKYYKDNTRILIVDDEIKFKLPKIFKDAGWIHSKLIKDIDNLDHDIVKNADILFVDVQGVGVSLGFKDEGLGLVEALKEKYPHKKVIIYSVVSQGDRFHNAFNVCDGQLSKDADPYQFQRVLEKFAFRGVNND